MLVAIPVCFRSTVPLQDSEDTNAPDLGEDPKAKPRTNSVDLETDTSLVVDICDALSEQEKVKFTVQTKVSGYMSPVDGGYMNPIDGGSVVARAQ